MVYNNVLILLLVLIDFSISSFCYRKLIFLYFFLWYRKSSLQKHNCTGKSKIPCTKCNKDFASSFTYLFHRCRRDPKQKERVYSSFSSRRSSISTIISPTIPVSSIKSGSSNSSDNSEVIFLRQRVQSLELIISQLSTSILELSNKILNQVSQVLGIPTYTMDSFMDPFDINTVADKPCSSANQNIVWIIKIKLSSKNS